MASILLLEDDNIFRTHLKMELSKYADVTEVGTIRDGLACIERQKFDLAFIDLDLTSSKDLEGLDFLKEVQSRATTPIVLTSHTSHEIIAKAYEAGCHYYFSKFDFIENIENYILPLINPLKNQNLSDLFKNQFITKSQALQKSVEHILDQSHFDQNILILGPTGIGKTQLAKIIHEQNGNKGEFVHVNLSELSENVIESELFGYKKGAFTGAAADKRGLFELADGGTLFLDEIGTVPLHIQKKLLKVIEEKKFFPLGSTTEKSVNFKLITATCDELSELMNQNKFRIDFYFRIKGVEITLPALADRKEDIVPLVQFFINKSVKKIAFSPEAMEALKNYAWIGNIRELQNFVKEMIFKSQGLVHVSDLPRYILENTNPLQAKQEEDDLFLTKHMVNFISENGLPDLIRKIEIEAMKKTMVECDGKVNEVGRRLKISKSLLYRINNDLKKEMEPVSIQ